jgi:hypothetical protein
MTLGDWLSAAVSLVAIVLIFIPKEIPYGSVMDHLGELGPDGRPVPNLWMVRQAKRDRMLRWTLVVVASSGLINLIVKALSK